MSGDEGDNNYSREKKLAGELIDNNLYQAAIDEYEKILADDDLDDEIAANIHSLIGRTSFEKLSDYEKAAGHYIRARSLNPNGSFFIEAGKNLIACFEKMGHLVDAKRALDQAVNIDSIRIAYTGGGGTLVAKIGEIPIYLSDLEDEIQKLPPEVQKQFLGVEGKRLFLNQYIGTELMYRAAIRENFQSDPEIIKKKNELEKQLLIQKFIMDNVMPSVNIDSADIRNYYLAHKDDKYTGKPYDEVQTQLFYDYQQEKAQQAFAEYVSKLAAVEKVRLFEENIK
jgi:tetratricopeptide (TPR) repeat protein